MPEIDIEIKPSKQFILLMLFFIISGGVVISLAQIQMLLKILFLILIVSYGGWLLFKYGFLKAKHSVKKLVFYEEQWFITTNHKGLQKIQVSGESTLTFLVMIISYKKIGNFFKESCVIFPDSVPDYRRLLVALRYK